MGKKSIDEITNMINEDHFQFSNNDFVVLQEAIYILEPYAEITLRIQSESAVTVSLVVLSTVHLMDHLNNMRSSVTYLKKMITQLEQSIHKRFSGIVKYLMDRPVLDDDPFSDQVYFIACVLDPQFKLHWLRQMNYVPTIESKVKQMLIQMVLNECEQRDNTKSDQLSRRTQYSPSPSRVSNDSATQSNGISAVKKRKLFHYEDGVNSVFDSKLNPVDQLNAFLNDPVRSKFLVYWKNSQFYSLKNVVKRIFSIQTSSAPVERPFSQAGLILTPRRTSVLEELF